MEFIKSLNNFKRGVINYKFELLELKKKEKLNQELITENKDQALSILRKHNISHNDIRYEKIKFNLEKVFKNFNFLGLLTRYLIEQDVSLTDIIDLMSWLKFNSGKLPKNALTYKLYEDLKDDIIKVDNEQRVRSIFNLLPSTQKNLVRGNEEFNNHALEIHKLGLIKQFGKKISVKKTLDDILEYMKDFIKKNSGISHGSVLQDLRKGESIVVLNNPDEGLLVAEILDYTTSKSVGSSDWCISYAENHWNSYTRGARKQFFMWDFSLDISDPLFMIGFTTNSLGQITDIHDKNDSSLSSDYPEKIVDVLSKLDFSVDPFKYKQELLKKLEDVEKIDTENRDIVLFEVYDNPMARRFMSNTWGFYYPFSGVKSCNLFMLYDFNQNLKSKDFQYGVEISEHGEYHSFYIKNNSNGKLHINYNTETKEFESSVVGEKKFKEEQIPEIIRNIYLKGLIYPRPEKEIIEEQRILDEEQKEIFIKKIEPYVKSGSEISSSWQKQKSKYINTSDEEGSTGNLWVFHVFNNDISHFNNDIINSQYFSNHDDISKYNTYVIVDIDKDLRDTDFIRYVKLGYDTIKIKFNEKSYDTIELESTDELPYDIKKLINDNYIKVKSSGDYSSELTSKRNKIIRESENDYGDDDVKLLGKVLYEYLIEKDIIERDEDEEDDEDEDTSFFEVLIPSGNHYGLKNFDIYSHDMVIGNYGNAGSYAIGTDDEADDAYKDNMENYFDEFGGGFDSEIDSEGVANYLDDEEYYRDEVTDTPANWDIERTEKDTEEREQKEQELSDLNEKLSNIKDQFGKAEIRLSDYEDFVESKLEKIEELIEELEYSDENTSERIVRLKTIRIKLNKRFEVNKLRYENLIEGLEERVDELDTEYDELDTLVDEMNDEDNDEYWEYSEGDIESKIEELTYDKKREVSDDPVGYLTDALGYSREEAYKWLNDNNFIDKDETVKSMMRDDNRGNCLSGYDGNENDFTWDDEIYYIYRTN